jgi:hypothetical protein
MLYCVAESRQWCEIGIRYLLITFRHFCPNGHIVIYYPEPCDDFKLWLRKIPQAEHITHFPEGANGWNCKPQALLPLLERGEKEVVWLDADVMLTRDPEAIFSSLSPDTLAVAEEPISSPEQGTEIRTRGWNLPVGRSFPRTFNSGVFRVTPYHIPLLKRWIELLAAPVYSNHHERNPMDKPVHLRGDQDVLNALIGSAEFAYIPVHYLRSGIDVLYSGGAIGYSLSERFRDLWIPMAPLVHGIGQKPWVIFDDNAIKKWELTGFSNWYRRLIYEVSPYVELCRRHRSEIDLTTPWLDKQSATGLFFRTIGFGGGHHSLSGLPLTVFATLLRRAGLL